MAYSAVRTNGTTFARLAGHVSIDYELLLL